MCLRPPVFHLFPLFSLAFLFYRLLLLTVDLSNICLWVMQTLAKCKLLSCTSEWGLFLRTGVYMGGEDVYSACPVVASIQLVMSSGVVRLVN